MYNKEKKRNEWKVEYYNNMLREEEKDEGILPGLFNSHAPYGFSSTELGSEGFDEGFATILRLSIQRGRSCTVRV